MAERVLIEKLEALEQKHGVEITATGFLEYSEYDEQYEVRVIGEVMGDSLDYDLSIIVSIYNKQGEIIGTDSCYIDGDTFEGIEPFSETISIPKGEELGKVRTYPKRN